MTDPIVKVREHYSPAGLTDRIKAALATIAPESQALKFAPLTNSTCGAFSPPPNWLMPLGSIHRRACWMLVAESAGQRVISPQLLRAR